MDPDGDGVGSNGGHVSILHSYSTGNIYGSQSGGLCGYGAGKFQGSLDIIYSSSSGNILGPQSGGLCGKRVAYSNGSVEIMQSYSLGKIAGINAGGLVGREAAGRFGYLHITNSYSRGEITGQQWAGGACGFKLGLNRGNVIIDSIYTSGHVKSSSAGGMIGLVANDAESIKIRGCVYNQGPLLGSKNARQVELVNNSNSLGDIKGKVHCPFPSEPEPCWDASSVWKVVSGQLPQLQIQVAPSATPSATPSPTTTATPSSTSTMTPTNSPSSSSSQSV